MYEEITLSILFVTYNSDLTKTKETLLSIIQQKNVSFEIIIADDGSKQNNFEDIKNFFQNHNFNNYKLVDNKENQGTVKNFISGLNNCSGKYVKPISPGDFFYSDFSLSNAYEFIKQNKASVYFGRTAYYSYENNKVSLFNNLANPKDLRPYKKQKLNIIKRNYFARRDSLLGASVIYNTDIIKSYIQTLSQFVKYAEDYSIFLMLANNEKISYMDFNNSNENFFIWYESSSGISTQVNSKWHDILLNELKNTYQYLLDKKMLSQKYYDCIFSRSKLTRFRLQLLLDPVYYLSNKIKKVSNKGWSTSIPDTALLLKIKGSI
ncbi:Glycosyl transferase family 2 [Treponema bryantii]|uniref:Glycosyl transferase family 2 n=1 Tax=Treponema bryantii TaxID=163 RepID=A0A1H9J3N6_9SPIR|nr:glycosyltransferase family 2 protein [Treponema bryantii]SEQ81443.1 Glycosyl transferase family 2 [Treponema bryantii]